MDNEIARLKHTIEVWKQAAKNWRDRACWDWICSSPQSLLYRSMRYPGNLRGHSARELLVFAQECNKRDRNQQERIRFLEYELRKIAGCPLDSDIASIKEIAYRALLENE
jgi:hypothetical protein